MWTLYINLIKPNASLHIFFYLVRRHLSQNRNKQTWTQIERERAKFGLNRHSWGQFHRFFFDIVILAAEPIPRIHFRFVFNMSYKKLWSSSNFYTETNNEICITFARYPILKWCHPTNCFEKKNQHNAPISMTSNSPVIPSAASKLGVFSGLEASSLVWPQSFGDSGDTSLVTFTMPNTLEIINGSSDESSGKGLEDFSAPKSNGTSSDSLSSIIAGILSDYEGKIFSFWLEIR